MVYNDVIYFIAYFIKLIHNCLFSIISITYQIMLQIIGFFENLNTHLCKNCREKFRFFPLATIYCTKMFDLMISINFSTVANLIPVHYGLQNGGEWRHAYSGGNENSMMSSENVAGRCTVGTIDVDGQRLSMTG